MNRGRLVAALGLGLLAAAARLSVAAVLPVDSQDAATLKPQIEKFLGAQITALTGTDFAASANARQAIIAEVTVTIPTAPRPSRTFLDLYADALATDLQPLLGDKDTRLRVNAALIVARVSEQLNSTRFADMTVKLLNDPSIAVVQWGAHAAQYVLPTLLSNPVQAKQTNLLPALLSVATKHATEPSLIEVTYYSLMVSDKGTNAVPPASLSAVVPQAVEAIQTLVEARLDLYQMNMAPMPTIEQIPFTYLVSDRIWNMTSPNQAALQHKTIELMSRLISDAAQRGPAAGINNRADLVDLLRKLGSDFQVVGQHVNNPALVEAGKKLGTVNAGAGNNFAPLADAVVAAVIAVPQFKDITAAPPLPATMPTSGPTTTP